MNPLLTIPSLIHHLSPVYLHRVLHRILQVGLRGLLQVVSRFMVDTCQNSWMIHHPRSQKLPRLRANLHLHLPPAANLNHHPAVSLHLAPAASLNLLPAANLYLPPAANLHLAPAAGTFLQKTLEPCLVVTGFDNYYYMHVYTSVQRQDLLKHKFLFNITIAIWPIPDLK